MGSVALGSSTGVASATGSAALAQAIRVSASIANAKRI
jgi:hypothetical protein